LHLGFRRYFSSRDFWRIDHAKIGQENLPRGYNETRQGSSRSSTRCPDCHARYSTKVCISGLMTADDLHKLFDHSHYFWWNDNSFVIRGACGHVNLTLKSWLSGPPVKARSSTTVSHDHWRIRPKSRSSNFQSSSGPGTRRSKVYMTYDQVLRLDDENYSTSPFGGAWWRARLRRYMPKSWIDFHQLACGGFAPIAAIRQFHTGSARSEGCQKPRARFIGSLSYHQFVKTGRCEVFLYRPRKVAANNPA